MIGELLCRFGRHKMKTHDWPLGYGKLPAAVFECERCGEVQEWAGAYDCVAMIGQWRSMSEFLGQNDQIQP